MKAFFEPFLVKVETRRDFGTRTGPRQPFRYQLSNCLPTAAMLWTFELEQASHQIWPTVEHGGRQSLFYQSTTSKSQKMYEKCANLHFYCLPLHTPESAASVRGKKMSVLRPCRSFHRLESHFFTQKRIAHDPSYGFVRGSRDQRQS